MFFFLISRWTFFRPPKQSGFWVEYWKKNRDTLIFYKHMNFSAKAFAKHKLCLFFRQKPLCAMWLFFLKAFMCLFSHVNSIELLFVLAKFCLWCAYFFQQKPSCAMCFVFFFFFEKKSLYVLNWPCAYKKWVTKYGLYV